MLQGKYPHKVEGGGGEDSGYKMILLLTTASSLGKKNFRSIATQQQQKQ